MYLVTATKTFYSGNLKGLSVPYACRFPCLGTAQQAQDALLKQPRDLGGNLVRYTEVKISLKP